MFTQYTSTKNSSGHNSGAEDDDSLAKSLDEVVLLIFFDKFQASFNSENSKESLLAGLFSIHKNDNLYEGL